MTNVIVLDSGPLGLLFQKPGITEADECRRWLAGHLSGGVRGIVPEIVNYELRRELIRLNLALAVAALDAFNRAVPDRYLPIRTSAIERAGTLWADARRAGVPTAHPHALDVDVILAAQVLDAGLSTADFVVATTNPVHLTRFVPCDLWHNVR